MSKPFSIFNETKELKRLSEMVFVEGGAFYIFDNVKNKHFIKVDSFYIGKYPITQAVWKLVMNGDNPSYFKSNNHPVEIVSWNKAIGFIEKLKMQTNRNYRLPTEAEWKYASQGGKYCNSFLYSGSNKLNEIGWYEGNSHGGTKPVGLKTSNFLDIYDMSGNVWEWCSDWYNDYEKIIEDTEKEHETGTLINPIGINNSTNRVFCGGSWDNNPQYCSSEGRYYYLPTDGNYLIGLRLVISTSEFEK